MVDTPAPKYGLPSSSFSISETQDEGTFTDHSHSELIPLGYDQASTPNPHYEPIHAPPPCRFSSTKRSQHISYAQDEPSECGGSDSSDEDGSQYEPPTENNEFFVDGDMPGSEGEDDENDMVPADENNMVPVDDNSIEERDINMSVASNSGVKDGHDSADANSDAGVNADDNSADVGSDDGAMDIPDDNGECNTLCMLFYITNVW